VTTCFVCSSTRGSSGQLGNGVVALGPPLAVVPSVGCAPVQRSRLSSGDRRHRRVASAQGWLSVKGLIGQGSRRTRNARSHRSIIPGLLRRAGHGKSVCGPRQGEGVTLVEVLRTNGAGHGLMLSRYKALRGGQRPGYKRLERCLASVSPGAALRCRRSVVRDRHVPRRRGRGCAWRTAWRPNRGSCLRNRLSRGSR
jgi:hypothetical protein